MTFGGIGVGVGVGVGGGGVGAGVGVDGAPTILDCQRWRSPSFSCCLSARPLFIRRVHAPTMRVYTLHFKDKAILSLLFYTLA